MQNQLESFPYLAQLLGGWFHQDFDLDGGTMETIVADYRKVSQPHTIAGVKADIKRFIHHAEENQADIDSTFVKQFSPDVLPQAWGMTAKEWLLNIYRLLES